MKIIEIIKQSNCKYWEVCEFTSNRRLIHSDYVETIMFQDGKNVEDYTSCNLPSNILEVNFDDKEIVIKELNKEEYYQAFDLNGELEESGFFDDCESILMIVFKTPIKYLLSKGEEQNENNKQ